MALCLTAGAVSAAIAAQAFTLAWVHSIEKVRWEEDWRIEGKQLKIVAARIRGTGAGMEPPADAVLRDGVWHYRPAIAPLDRLTLPDSAYTAGYELCSEGNCRPLRSYLPASALAIVMTPCPR
ncbi:MAG: DUF1850 domain-containing protein [Betaproteobacteria bacterium]|nr:DUF1850 domain-containing protein [Betaproteobacteria bacterium]